MNLVGRIRNTLCALLLMGSGIVYGQFFGERPEVPRQFLDRTRQLEGDQIRFCVYEGGITEATDRAFAEEIANTLLVEASIVTITSAVQIDGLDFIPITEDEFYIHLTSDCDAFMGIALADDVYPDWMAFTRPYARANYVAITGPAVDVASVGQLPSQSAIGTSMLSEADIRFLSYNASLSEARRWRRIPFAHNARALERLVDGTVDVVLLWEPVYEYLQERVPGAEDTRTVSMSPIPSSSRSLGIVVRSNEAFLRSMLDEAIQAIINDEAYVDVYEDSGFPGVRP